MRSTFPLVRRILRRQRLAVAALAAALTGAALFCFLFPVPSPPPLPGPHGVGTLTFEIPAAGNAPRLLVQAWFPSPDASGGEPVPWLPDVELAPSFPFHRIASAMARARSGVRISPPDGPGLPVIFYEHSWTGHRAENIAQVEALASKGFVIIAMDHPGQAGRVRYRDGSVVRSSLPASIDLDTRTGIADFEKIARRSLDERMSNVERVRKALEADAVPEFRGKLRLANIGVFGFSFGGTSALRLCARHPSFHAGANEDGLYMDDEMPRGPFLFFDQELPPWLLAEASHTESAGQSLTRKAEGRIRDAMKHESRQRAILEGTTHESFNDRIFLCRFPELARAGKRPAAEVHNIIVTRLADFFSRGLVENP